MQDIPMSEVVKVSEWGEHTVSTPLLSFRVNYWARPILNLQSWFLFQNDSHSLQHRASLLLFMCPGFIYFSKEKFKKKASLSGPLIDNLLHSYYHLIFKLKKYGLPRAILFPFPAVLYLKRRRSNFNDPLLLA